MSHDRPAGPELDRLVHERVMGFHVRELPAIPPFDRSAPLDIKPGQVWLVHGAPARLEEVPAYSTDIEQAWAVVEKMQAHGLCVDVTACFDQGFNVSVKRNLRDPGWPLVGASDAPLAICRAALLAVAAPRLP